ncbi:fimbrial isopeptide formation D2 domain [Corynebacterium mustelae]|uniref:Fimbrial isopeptide formation D2 domain n=1 Tax=Corynebacterium mustelae TaxID=571915 RepID=A0A0G3H6X4_9CORY|nr:SpaH/EbpB family LPXTG-anchored major pilin [Corynebacterium mustelae]AKK06892.1 fimbrial isopeptide formation D2 domain [Corynebacterium mustelae]
MRNRTAAIIAAAVVAFSGTVFNPVVFPLASAQSQNDPVPGSPAHTMDLSQEVSLTIKKRLGDPQLDARTAEGLPGVNNAQFKIEKITLMESGQPVALNTDKAFKLLKDMTAANLGEAQAEVLTTVNTGPTGDVTVTKATHSDFTAGVYRITELQSGDFSVAKPFLVVLPTTDNAGKWVYSREVLPKGQSVKPTKTVEPKDATIGKTLTYTISAPVPAGEISTFKISDSLMAGLSLASVESVAAVGGTSGSQDLSNSGYFQHSVSGQDLSWTFEQTGFERLMQLRKVDSDLKVVITFKVTVNSIPGDGVITNTANVDLPNGLKLDTDVQGPDGKKPTSTTFGDLTVNLTAEGASPGDNIAGAQFELYRCEQGAGGKWEVKEQPVPMNDTDSGDSIVSKISSVDQGGGAGLSKALGFNIPTKYSNSQTDLKFCVVQTKAPDGYMRNPEPQPVEITDEGRVLTSNITNYKDSIVGQLPATGAKGVGLILLLGLLLTARGLYTSYRDRKVA